jgi:hypothetical protein
MQLRDVFINWKSYVQKQTYYFYFNTILILLLELYFGTSTSFFDCNNAVS